MATAVKIRIRRDTTANWISSNPVLAIGEIAADMDLHRIKVGNGTSKWTDLAYCDGDIINVFTSDRTDAALSAAKGKEEAQAGLQQGRDFRAGLWRAQPSYPNDRQARCGLKVR